MSNRIQIRRDSTWNWQTSNPILADGEIALEYDTNKVKVGDGSTYWNDLAYMTGHLTNLAAVATSGSYLDLSNRPSGLIDIIGSWSSLNHRRFLRLNTQDNTVDYSSDFRIVPRGQVSYPAGIANQDKVGDVTFDNNFMYYCKAEPNILGTVPLTWAGGYSNQGWITITSIYSTGRALQINDKVTDGTSTATVVEIVEGWPGYNGSRQIVRVSPEVPLWHGGSPATLTVLTSGTTANTDCWVRYPAFGSAPANLSSDGVSGQMAVDSNYIYACTRSNVTEVSATYATPKSTNTPGWPGGNQRNGASTFTVTVANSGPTPQVGWILSDGSSQRTITSVAAAQASVWGQIIDLTFSGGDIDWTGLNSITIISTPAVSGSWVKAKWFSGSYNDLTDKPVVAAPATSKGVSGNKAGMVAYSSGYFYYCTTDYTDGTADIWVRSAWDQTSWS